MSDKNLVFLTEGPEGWDTPIADLVAACGDVGQKAVLIDLLKSDSSALLGKAAGEGIAAFVSMEGVGARITANNRSIFEVLQAPLLTFLPDHPCFYAPLLTTPQKLVVPMFFSQDHVTAARGIFGNVPLAPVIEPWGPRSLELEGEPVPAIFVDASTFEVAKALEGQHPRVRELVGQIQAEVGGTDNYPDWIRSIASSPADAYRVWHTNFSRPPVGVALGTDIFAAFARTLDVRFIPLDAIRSEQRARICQWVACVSRVATVHALIASGAAPTASGVGWPSAAEPRLTPLARGQRGAFDASTPAAALDSSDALKLHRNRARQAGATDRPANAVRSLVHAASSSVFLDVALSGVR